MIKTQKKQKPKKEKVVKSWFMIDIVPDPSGTEDNDINIDSTLEEAYKRARKLHGDNEEFYAFKVTPLGKIKEKLELVK